MPSSTTSHYQRAIQAGLSVPMLSLVDEVVAALAAQGFARVGLLGTTPTRTYGVYEDAFARHHLTVVYPDEASQNQTMQIIWEVKGHGSRSPGRVTTPQTSQPLLDILNRAWSRSTDAILLACTELPVVGRFLLEQPHERPIVSATDILAQATIRYALTES
jgi:aspartate racemase